MENSKRISENQKNPAISVIVPCYNQGEFVAETIRSVLNQTFDDFEIIIVDDGSTDKVTLMALNKLENEYPEIKIIHQINSGPASARNNGIKISRGKYFLPLDADDTIEPTMLEKCYKIISEEPALGFVSTYTNFFGTENAIWKNPEYNFYDLLMANSVTVCALVRKKAWEEVGGYDGARENKYEDWEFWINLGKHNWFGKVIKEPLFNYRKHGESRMGSSELSHDASVKYIHEKHKELYTKESLREIKNAWRPRGEKFFEKSKSKLRATGIGDAELWKKNPLAAVGRLIPVRIKRKINLILQKKIFDTSYYRRSDE